MTGLGEARFGMAAVRVTELLATVLSVPPPPQPTRVMPRMAMTEACKMGRMVVLLAQRAADRWRRAADYETGARRRTERKNTGGNGPAC